MRRPFRARWWRERWARLTRFLRRSPKGNWAMPGVAPLAMPELLDVQEPSDTFTIETPAMGDGFNFLIRVRCSWCVAATTTEKEVRAFTEESRAIIRERLEEMIRPVARRFPPYRAAEAEKLLNRKRQLPASAAHRALSDRRWRQLDCLKCHHARGR